MANVSLVSGIICIVISMYTHILGIKEVNSVKEKLNEVMDFIIDPFTGLNSLFYLGLLLVLYGFVATLNLI